MYIDVQCLIFTSPALQSPNRVITPTLTEVISHAKWGVTALSLWKCNRKSWIMTISWPLFFFFFYRLSGWILWPRVKLRLLPSRSTFLPSPDSRWSRIHALLRPSWNPSREHGPPSRSPPPLHWDTMLQWDDIASPRGLPQPRAQRTRLHPQYLHWHVWLHSTLHIPELS